MIDINFLINTVLPLITTIIIITLASIFVIKKVKSAKIGEIKVIFLKSIGDDFEKIGEKKIEKNETTITFKDKTFPITGKCVMFINSGTPHIFIDFESEKVLKFNEKGIGISARFLDMLLTTSKKGIIGQLMYALHLDMDTKTDWSKMAKPIVIFILGAIIGYLVGSPTGLSGGA